MNLHGTMLAERKNAAIGRVSIANQDIEYRLRAVPSNGKIRIRVGVGGVEVLQPASRDADEVESFIHANGAWVLAQLERVARIRSIRRARQMPVGEILFRGEPTRVSVEDVSRRKGSNQVRWDGSQLMVVRGRLARNTAAQTLENWLRRQARARIEPQISVVAQKLAVVPGRLYIMDQQTKWGNCSALRNLSFNWRIVMAPDGVLNYLVTHEVAHLAVPDHSHKFWLTVQSLCPESERARQWLSANGHRLLISLPDVLEQAASQPG